MPRTESDFTQLQPSGDYPGRKSKATQSVSTPHHQKGLWKPPKAESSAHRSAVSHSPLVSRLLYWFGPLLSLLLAFLVEHVLIKQEFFKAADQAAYQVETKLNTSEVALEGFANFLSNAHDTDDHTIRAYVQGFLKLFPYLYMFEISTMVEGPQRSSFEKAMQSSGYPDFRIHGFDFDSERSVIPVREQDVYYPIRFIEPETADTRAVLGLDLNNSSAELVDSLLKSWKAPRAIASPPFELIEGGRGYVLYRPVVFPADMQNRDMLRPTFAMLVIRIRDLLPDWLQNQPGYTASLNYQHKVAETRPKDFGETVVAGSAQQSITGLSYSTSTDINSESQPFDLTIQKNFRWTDLHLLRMLALFLAGTLLSVYMAHRITSLQRWKISATEEQKLLYHQANFDPLTDLPNINLLTDRAEQAINIANRSGDKVAICYLDIDKFKSINDRWGHEAGDTLLIEVAARLKKILRNEDTVARIHGDEFIVLLPDIPNFHVLDLIANKILSTFSHPFYIAAHQLQVKGSIGIALFPDDARDLETLLHISDRRMYDFKYAEKESTGVTNVDSLFPADH